MNKTFFESILESILANPKTSIATIIGAICFLVAKFGFDVPADVQQGILAVAVWIALMLTKDGDK